MDNFNQIVNCDETPLFFEMIENRSIENKGEKEVIIHTNGLKKNILLVY